MNTAFFRFGFTLLTLFSLTVVGCGGDGTSTSASSGRETSSSTGGGMGQGGNGGSGGSGGNGGNGGNGGSAGGNVAGGISGAEIVGAGTVVKSDKYRMIVTVGPSTPGPGSMKSSGYRIQGGLVGITEGAK